METIIGFFSITPPAACRVCRACSKIKSCGKSISFSLRRERKVLALRKNWRRAKTFREASKREPHALFFDIPVRYSLIHEHRLARSLAFLRRRPYDLDYFGSAYCRSSVSLKTSPLRESAVCRFRLVYWRHFSAVTFWLVGQFADVSVI